jgi:nitrous oxidase accessory protein NosD
VKKILVTIIGLFVLIGNISLIQANQPTMNIIYVDDDNTEGPWDGTTVHPYRSIQQAIDNATEGDTIFVYSGMYCEHVTIKKPLKIVGEDRQNTIIQGNKGTIVFIRSHEVNFSGFTVQGGVSMIEVYCTYLEDNDNIVIMNNILKLEAKYCAGGIYLTTVNNTIVKNNIIEFDSNDTYIYGMYILGGKNCLIKNNCIVNRNTQRINDIGIFLTSGGFYGGSSSNTIILDEFQYLGRGIDLLGSSRNEITCNNFKDNKIDATFINAKETYWHENYWGNQTGSIKIIHGRYVFFMYPLGFPWINIDWKPAKEPYDIPMI